MASVAADEQVSSAGDGRREDPIVGRISAPGSANSGGRQVNDGELVQQGNELLQDRLPDLQLLDEHAFELGENQIGNQKRHRSFGGQLEQSARRTV